MLCAMWLVLGLSTGVPPGCQDDAERPGPPLPDTSSVPTPAPDLPARVELAPPADTEPPTLHFLAPLPDVALTREGGEIEVEVLATDGGSGLAEVRLEWPGGARTLAKAAGERSLTRARVPAREGLVTLVATARDAAGLVTQRTLSIVVADRWVASETARLPVSVDRRAFGPRALGAVLDALLAEVELEGRVPTRLGSALGQELELKRLTHEPLMARVSPADGLLEVIVAVPRLRADARLTGLTDRDVVATAAGLDIRSTVMVSGGGGRLVVGATPVTGALRGLDLGLIGALEPLVDAVAATAEAGVAAAVTARWMTAVQDAGERAQRWLDATHEWTLRPPSGTWDGAPPAMAARLSLNALEVGPAGVEAALDVELRGAEPSLPTPGQPRACSPAWSGAQEGHLGLHLPLDLLNAAMARTVARGRTLTLPPGTIPGTRGPLQVALHLPPHLTRCGANEAAVVLQVAGLELKGTADALIGLPIEGRVAFDLALDFEPRADGALVVAAELVPGSLVSQDPKLAALARVVLAALGPWDLGPVDAPGGEVRVVAVQPAGAGLNLRGALVAAD